MNKLTSLCIFLGINAAIAFIGNLYTMPAVTSWYQTINKAPWNPPDYVFGPVWTILYILIAISGWRVWQKLPGSGGKRLTSLPMRWYGAQLAFNAAWSVIFFGYASFNLAIIDIILLLISIIGTIRIFRRTDKPAARMFIPYGLWATYATTLNIAIAVLN